jgi:hypothetical protein
MFAWTPAGVRRHLAGRYSVHLSIADVVANRAGLCCDHEVV